MFVPTPFPSRFGAGGQFDRVTQGYAPMGVPSALRYSQGNVPGNPGVGVAQAGLGALYLSPRTAALPGTGPIYTPGASGLYGLDGIYGQGTGLFGLDGLTFDGTGLFGTGLFGSGAWGLGEWVTIGLGAFLAFRAVRGFGGRSGRRRKLSIIRDKYQLERDTA